MTYRDPIPVAQPLPFRVIHGPFKTRPFRAVIAPALLALGVFLAFGSLDSERLSCEVGPDATCTLSEGVIGFRRERMRFSRADLGEIKLKTVRKGVGVSEVVNLTLMVGSRSIRLHRTSGDQARQFAATVARARERGLPIDETSHFSVFDTVFGLVCGFAFVLAAFLSFHSGVRGFGRVVIDVDPRRREIRCQRRVLHVPISSTTHRLLDGFVIGDVEVELGEEDDPGADRLSTEKQRQVGRLVLVSTGGHRLPLLERRLPGRVVHMRAAAELRRAFALRPGRLEEELASFAGVEDYPRWVNPGVLISALFFAVVLGAVFGFGLIAGICAWVVPCNGDAPALMYVVILPLGMLAGVGSVLFVMRRRPRE